MSDSLKGKYEVLKIIRSNVLAGLHTFGIDDWGCAEADQPGIKNMDKVVTLKFMKMERVGIQGNHYEQDAEDPDIFWRVEHWMEEQTWEIKALFNRVNQTVTAETVTTEDIACMLAGWFNGPGVDEFRKNGCGNLFVNLRDIKMYTDESGVPQNASTFPLKLHVPKEMKLKIPSALVKFEGFVPV